MPLLSANETGIRVKCDNCEVERDVAFVDIEAGVSLGDANNPDICRLTPCACGSVEHLIRTWDEHPKPGSRSQKLYAATNRVFKKLIDLGRVNTECADAIAAEESDPPNIDATPLDPGQSITLAVVMSDPG